MMKVVPVVLTFAALSIGLADRLVAQGKKADTSGNEFTDILQELREWQHRQMLRFDKWMETEGKKEIPDADQSQQSVQQPLIRPLPEPLPPVREPVFRSCGLTPHPSCRLQLPQHDWPPYRLKVERRIG
jgi:hypothetical protein